MKKWTRLETHWIFDLNGFFPNVVMFEYYPFSFCLLCSLMDAQYKNEANVGAFILPTPFFSWQTHEQAAG